MVAYATVGGDTIRSGELALMVVFMATGTGVVGQWVGVVGCFMAFLTIYADVFSQQGEIGACMVEIIQVIYLLEGVFGMTFGTVVS